MDTALRDIHTTCQSSLPVGVVGFVDDIYVYISDRCMIDAAAVCTDLIRANRMAPKPASCSVLVQPGRSHLWAGRRAEDSGFSTSTDGFQILGAPVGTAAYRLQTCSNQIQSMARSLHQSNSM